MEESKMKGLRIAGILLFVTLVFVSCNKKKPGPPKEVDYFTCNSINRVVAQELVAFDKSVSSDGDGSIMIKTAEPVTVRFLESKLPGENCKYTYKVKMKTDKLNGDAYLSMDINYPNGGKQSVQQEIQSYLSDNNDWTPMEITITAPNQKPASVLLNVVVDGEGTVWIDDLHLIATPLG
jgi:hypothetical protein